MAKKFWIQDVVKRMAEKGTLGAFRRQTKTKEGKDISAKKIAKAKKSKDVTTRKRAVLAATFRKIAQNK